MQFLDLLRPVRLVTLLVLASASLGAATPDRSFTLAPAQALEVRALIRLLEEVHYNRDAIKAADYGEVVPNYMRELDGQRLFFLQSDLEAFTEKNKPETLYWNITSLGRVEPAFEIFTTYETRVRERVQWIFDRLSQDFDLTTNDSYAFDRKELPWAANPADADVLWERRLKFELLQEVLNKKTIDEAREVIRKRYERMLRNVADIEAPDLAEMFLGTVARMYDPHSTYFSADTFEDFSISMRLQLFGIGALLGVDEDVCVIKEIIPGGPADLSKQLKPNDKILAVAQADDEPVEIIGMKLRKIVEMIRGKKDTQVRLVIQPGDAADASIRREITLVRDIVNLDSARAHAAVFDLPGEDGATVPIGVITLPTFYGRDASAESEQTSASHDVAELIKRLKTHGIQGLVLDLRGNGGGLLSEAIDLTGLFIPSGPVVQIKSYYGDVKIDSDNDPAVAYDGPLVVLTSRFSASASEIVAGALQNYGRAVIVGDSSTHGKGSVQTVIEMKNVLPALSRASSKTGATKLTIQKFYLPNGASTQRKGVVPDIVLPSIDDYLPIGEADLPHALGWDEISTSFFEGKPIPDAALSPLRQASTNRQASLEEFSFLRQGIDRFRQRQEEKVISLNLEERERRKSADAAFREQMETERKKLEEDAFAFTEILLAPPPPPRIKAPAEKDEEGDVTELDSPRDDERYGKADVHLRESLRVVADLLAAGTPEQLAATGKKTAAAAPARN